MADQHRYLVLMRFEVELNNCWGWTKPDGENGPLDYRATSPCTQEEC